VKQGRTLDAQTGMATSRCRVLQLGAIEHAHETWDAGR
jgi:hypothetical protein